MTFTLWSRREQLGFFVECAVGFEPISARIHPLDPDPAEMSLLMMSLWAVMGERSPV
jgi:hypothetical protein